MRYLIILVVQAKYPGLLIRLICITYGNITHIGSQGGWGSTGEKLKQSYSFKTTLHNPSMMYKLENSIHYLLGKNSYMIIFMELSSLFA